MLPWGRARHDFGDMGRGRSCTTWTCGRVRSTHCAMSLTPA